MFTWQVWVEVSPIARCCGGGCSCNIQSGTNIVVSGIGSSGDPFVIATDLVFNVVDTDVINLTLTGAGTAVSPWGLSAEFAATAQLDDLPDVNAPAPTNAQVLGWDSTTQRWTPRAPTTAAAGSVVHDPSLSGDGSAGSPLTVFEDPNGYLTTGAGGLGLTSIGINQMVRKFTTTTTRDAASPAPVLNSLSEVNTNPGVVDYWTGSQWLPIKDEVSFEAAAGTTLLDLSGDYTTGERVQVLVKRFSGSTAADGAFTLLTATEVAQRSILTCTVTVFGPQAYLPVVQTGENYVYMVARRIDDGSVLAGSTVAGHVIAYLF